MTDIHEYEKLLLRRDKLKKEAEQWHIEYVATFGEYIKESFELKVECIKTKKMISYCQARANRCETISGTDLMIYIDTEMEKYNRELETLIDTVSSAKKSVPISATEVRKIKELYRRIAKMVHPDLHPELADDEVINNYWNKVVISYEHNCMTELEELHLVITSRLKEIYGDDYVPDIDLDQDTINTRVNSLNKEIDEILSTNPYLYRLVLESREGIDEERERYEEEITSYLRYLEELKGLLTGFDIQEGKLS